MSAPATEAQPRFRNYVTPEVVEIRELAQAAGGVVWRLAGALLLARARSAALVAGRAAHLAEAVALWPAVTAAMAELEARTPAAAQSGWLSDAEFMDQVEAVQARAGRALAAEDPAIAAAGLAATLMGELFGIVRAGPEPRGILRGRLEAVFEAWPQLCRRMACVSDLAGGGQNDF